MKKQKLDLPEKLLLTIALIALFGMKISIGLDMNEQEEPQIRTEYNFNDCVPYREVCKYTWPETEETQEIYFPNTERYAGISITKDDIDLMACIVFLESNTETFSGQRLVAEVILNRVLQGDMGGKTIHDVIYARNQFSTAKNVGIAKPTEQNYAAVYAALNETPITDENVVFFARSPYNDKIFCKIGGHYFCYR